MERTHNVVVELYQFKVGVWFSRMAKTFRNGLIHFAGEKAILVRLQLCEWQAVEAIKR